MSSEPIGGSSPVHRNSGTPKDESPDTPDEHTGRVGEKNIPPGKGVKGLSLAERAKNGIKATSDTHPATGTQADKNNSTEG